MSRKSHGRSTSFDKPMRTINSALADGEDNDFVPDLPNDHRYFSDGGPRQPSQKGSSRRFSADTFNIPSSAKLMRQDGSPVSKTATGYTSSYSNYLRPLRNKAEQKQPEAVDKTSLLQDLIISSVISMKNLPKLSVQDGKEPLSMTTTTNNFRRFVQKAGPIFVFQDKVESIIKWENPIHTILTMVVYSIVCLYPQLIILAPQVVIVTILVSTYQKRHPHSLSSTTSRPPPEPEYPAVGSIDYLKNLQNIQNMMGMVGDGAEEVEKLALFFNWSETVSGATNYDTETESTTYMSPTWSLLILQGCVISSLLLVLGPIWWIPWRYVLLSGGWMGIMATTPFFRALTLEINPFLNTSSNVDMLKEALQWWTRDVSEYRPKMRR